MNIFKYLFKSSFKKSKNDITKYNVIVQNKSMEEEYDILNENLKYNLHKDVSTSKFSYDNFLLKKINMENNLFYDLILCKELLNIIEFYEFDSYGIRLKLLINEDISVKYIHIQYMSFNLHGEAKIAPYITLLKDSFDSIIYNRYIGYQNNKIIFFKKFSSLVDEIIRIHKFLNSSEYFEDIYDQDDMNYFIEYTIED